MFDLLTSHRTTFPSNNSSELFYNTHRFDSETSVLVHSQGRQLAGLGVRCPAVSFTRRCLHPESRAQCHMTQTPFSVWLLDALHPAGNSGALFICDFFCYFSSSVSVRRTYTGCRWLSCAPCRAAPVRSQSPGWAVGAAAGWGGGAGFCGPPTRSGAVGREWGGLETKRACDAGQRIMLTTGPWRGWSEGMNPDYSEPDSALSSSERRAPIPESR